MKKKREEKEKKIASGEIVVKTAPKVLTMAEQLQEALEKNKKKGPRVRKEIVEEAGPAWATNRNTEPKAKPKERDEIIVKPLKSTAAKLGTPQTADNSAEIKELKKDNSDLRK